MSKLIKIFLFAFLILFSESFLFAQVSAEEKNPVSETSVLNSSEVDETSITLTTSETPSNVAAGGGSSFFLVVRMIIVLAIVIAAIYGVLWFFRRSMRTDAGDDQFLRQVASINVAPGKSVQVVTLTDKHAFLIGVSDNSVSLISKIDDLELVQAMNLYSDKNKKISKPRTFQDILDIFMPGGPRGEGVFSASGRSEADFLEKQRDRLNGGE
ncbi:MAG: flagellar biosynthetic protein FliO [Treponema sp.]|nr:flagellar biosynthetic protein FliO [Treponema sp.]